MIFWTSSCLDRTYSSTPPPATIFFQICTMFLGPVVARQVFWSIESLGPQPEELYLLQYTLFREKHTSIWLFSPSTLNTKNVFSARSLPSAPLMVLFSHARHLNFSEGVSSWISPQYRGSGGGRGVRVSVQMRESGLKYTRGFSVNNILLGSMCDLHRI